jgi:hypothetical protein
MKNKTSQKPEKTFPIAPWNAPVNAVALSR